MAQEVRPIDLVVLRNEMSEWANAWGSSWAHAVGGDDHPFLPAVMRSAFALADLFHVSKDMTSLASVAGQSLPDFVVQPGDLPADIGMMIYEAGAGEFIEPRATLGEDGAVVTKGREAIQRGIAWISAGSKVGLFLLRDRAETQAPLQPGAKMPPLMPYGYAEIVYGQSGIEQRFDAFSLSKHSKTFLAASLLMSQPGLGESRLHQMDRLDRARLRRQHVKPSPVRVITLRRLASERPGEAEAREYHHRWVVRGHWRQQPCGPGRTERRPVWITPHIKGPEGAPLLTGEKVYSWVR